MSESCQALHESLAEAKRDLADFASALREAKASRDRTALAKVADRRADMRREFWEMGEILFSRLIAREKSTVEAFFEKTIQIMPLPNEITWQKYREWKKMGFELHYLPDEDMHSSRELPFWQEKPMSDFYEWEQRGAIEKGAYHLPDPSHQNARWVLVETRPMPKPGSSDPKDPLAPLLAELMRQGLLKSERPGSRFGISSRDLHKADVSFALCKALHIPGPAELRLPRVIERNYLANALYPGWSGKGTWEHVEEFVWRVSRPEALVVGYQRAGDLALAFREEGHGDTAFRLIVSFHPTLNWHRREFKPSR